MLQYISMFAAISDPFVSRTSPLSANLSTEMSHTVLSTLTYLGSAHRDDKTGLLIDTTRCCDICVQKCKAVLSVVPVVCRYGIKCNFSDSVFACVCVYVCICVCVCVWEREKGREREHCSSWKKSTYIHSYNKHDIWRARFNGTAEYNAELSW